MTISLTLILLEATGDMQYVLPLMLTLLTARFVGNLINEGIYETHIRLKELPFLEATCPPVAETNGLIVTQIMSENPVTFNPVMRVSDVYEILKSNDHNCFPVIDLNSNLLIGTILRKVLTVLLKSRSFGPSSSDPNSSSRISPLVSWTNLEIIYPRYPSVLDIHLSNIEGKGWLDLRPYLDRSPYLVKSEASVKRAYRMFRTLGLRHLLVVGDEGSVVGIITRHDLTDSSLNLLTR